MKESENDQLRAKLFETVEELQHDLATLDSIHQSIMVLHATLAQSWSDQQQKVANFLNGINNQLASGTDPQQILLDEAKHIQEMNMSFNMQYLHLQQKMQDESRRFTLLSNIMKTKQDTAKNSISNIR